MILNRADYAGLEISEEENITGRRRRAKEGVVQLGSWTQLLKNQFGRDQAGVHPQKGETIGYRDWFDEELSE